MKRLNEIQNNDGGFDQQILNRTVAPECKDVSCLRFVSVLKMTSSNIWGLAMLIRSPGEATLKLGMDSEYCPTTEIQIMEQELWTLTLKGDDIEAYNNRFHELEDCKVPETALSPFGPPGNVTSSKPATLHDAINMARELIEQGVQAKALRIGDSNKGTPAKGRGYAGNLPWCNRCKAHHQPGPCLPLGMVVKCHKPCRPPGRGV
ncbi:hypothetical protein Tco_0298389 [Tanacetum coccineum]